MSEDGLAALAMLHRPALLRFLAARGAGADAEDLFQELWMKARSIPAGPISHPLAYLYRTADNLMLDRRRAENRSMKRDVQWADVAGHSGSISEEPSAERVLLARERLQAVYAKLASLSDKTATIFRRYRVDGVPQKDIAAEYGITVSAVEKHLQTAYRAIIDIRSMLDAESSQQRRPDLERTDDVTR